MSKCDTPAAVRVEPPVRRHARTLRDLLACCNAWEPQACVLGNVRAGDAAEAIVWVLANTLRAHALAAEQADDDGLWFVAQTAPEAYLQDALRNLAAAVEGPTYER